MLHMGYAGWHAGLGGFVGKRTFSVMHDGFGVQHHAMEFDRTVMFALGKKVAGADITLKYLSMRATELAISNPDVTVKSVILSVGYRF